MEKEEGSTLAREETRDKIIFDLSISDLALVCMGCWLNIRGAGLGTKVLEGLSRNTEADTGDGGGPWAMVRDNPCPAVALGQGAARAERDPVPGLILIDPGPSWTGFTIFEPETGSTTGYSVPLFFFGIF